MSSLGHLSTTQLLNYSITQLLNYSILDYSTTQLLSYSYLECYLCLPLRHLDYLKHCAATLSIILFNLNATGSPSSISSPLFHDCPRPEHQ